MNLSIRFLAKYPVLTESDIRDINELMKQLSSNAPEANLLTVTEARNSGAHIAVMRDLDTPGNRIVGMATLVEKRQLMGYFGLIEDVVVLKAFRGRGIATALNRCLIEKAKTLGMKHLIFTSDFTRVAVHKTFSTSEYDYRDITSLNSLIALGTICEKLGYIDRDMHLRCLLLS